MNMRCGALVVFLLAVASSVLAQTQPQQLPDPVVSATREMQDRQSKNLIAAAEEMPEALYGFKPTPGQMSFGHLVVHVIESNNNLCSLLGSQKQKVGFADTDPKATLVNGLKDSFWFCKQVLNKASDASLGVPVQLPGGNTGTQGAVLIRLVSGWADHYSAAAMYLRLNNFVPPSAK
jgi:hypothetical protein